MIYHKIFIKDSLLWSPMYFNSLILLIIKDLKWKKKYPIVVIKLIFSLNVFISPFGILSYYVNKLRISVLG